MPRKRLKKKATPAAPQPAAQVEVVDEAQRRRELLRDRFPQLYARVKLLEKLTVLQQVRGGEFAPRYVFLHMPDYILNIRRVGAIDPDGPLVALEVYPHNDIVPGIIWVPLDHIWWIGTTDEAYGLEQVGLRSSKEGLSQPDAAYREARLKLAGFAPPG